jgi:hypothetical protein
MDLISKQPLAALARIHAKAGAWDAAQAALIQLTTEVIGLPATSLTINQDQYSLNSLNGFVTLDNGESLFFKYHNEEGEERTIDEYYNAALLKDAGYLVDVPKYQCGEPGRQILFYQKRTDRRLADVCRDMEFSGDDYLKSAMISAQEIADQQTLACTRRSFQMGDVTLIAREPIHQLFYHRLVDDNLNPGFEARVKRFYINQTFQLGDCSLDWSTFSTARWQINGKKMCKTVAELMMESAIRLNPIHLSEQGVVCAHGDAHNANVWFEKKERDDYQLVYFDPAFAGRQIPTLLAEIKATFHNIFAHPFWLYEPSIAEARYQAKVRYEAGTIIVEHDWQLSALRQAFLASKAEHYWRPLLKFMRQQGVLPHDWQAILRCGLFCCPTLVMPLLAGLSNHNPTSSAVGWSVAIMLGSGAEDGSDLLGDWLLNITP